MPNKILLASHGTVGARAAEQVLFNTCLVDDEVIHLYVVPEFWKHILGDDWLNNQITQKRFGDYLQSELAHEADETITRIQTTLSKQGIKNTHLFVFGNPQKCLLRACIEHDVDLVVTGSPRPKNISGLHSRMTTNSLKKSLNTTLLQIPYPHKIH